MYMPPAALGISVQRQPLMSTIWRVLPFDYSVHKFWFGPLAHREVLMNAVLFLARIAENPHLTCTLGHNSGIMVIHPISRETFHAPHFILCSHNHNLGILVLLT